MENNEAIILYDGFCRLCNGTVRFLIKRDKKKVFQYVALQSEKGQEILRKYNVADIDSVVFVYRNQAHARSDAFVELIGLLPSPWKWIRVVKYIPKKWLDFLYDLIAKYRYRWFGKFDSCVFHPDNLNSL